MNIDIVKLARAEVRQAGRLLARAFAEDPIITHFMYGRIRRRIAFPAFFGAVLEEMLPSGHVYGLATAENSLALLRGCLQIPPSRTLRHERRRLDTSD